MRKSQEVVRIRAIRNVFDSYPRRRSGHKGVPLRVLARWYEKAFPGESLWPMLMPLLSKKQLLRGITPRGTLMFY